MQLDDSTSFRSFDRRHAFVALMLVGALITLPFFDMAPAALRDLALQATGTRMTVQPSSTVGTPSEPPVVAAVPAAQQPATSTPNSAKDPLEAPAGEPTENAAPAALPSDAKSLATTPPPPSDQPSPLPPIARIYFDMREENLSSEAREALAPFVAYLKENGDAAVRVVGYYPRGDSASGSNAALMWQRTLAVREAFERAGIARDRVVTLRPIDASRADGPTARRVDVAIASPTSALFQSRRSNSKPRLQRKYEQVRDTASKGDEIGREEPQRVEVSREEVGRAQADRAEMNRKETFPEASDLGEIHRGEIF